MMDEVRTYHFRQGKSPHRVTDRFENFIDQESRKGSRTLGAAGRAESPFLAACGHKKLVAAVQTFDAGKTCLESTTVKVGVDNIIDKTTPETVDPLEALFPHAFHRFVMGLHEPV